MIAQAYNQELHEHAADDAGTALDVAEADTLDETATADDTDNFADSDEVRIYEHHRIHVDPGQEPQRVDVWLSMKIKHLSRSRIKNAADVGFIRVNDKPVKVSYKVRPRDIVSITLPYPPAPDLKPERIALDVIYEDDELLVINKPVGLVCHPGVGNYNGTLVNGLLYYFSEQKEVLQRLGKAPAHDIRPGLVHRIDKDTTGLLVIAKSELAYNFLARQFFEHTTHRLYYALVWGNLEQDAGTINANIIRNPSDRKRYMVTDDPTQGKRAVTHYRVLQRFGVCTLVECKLETGRTHQIRVHFKYLGHTLFNDKFYGGHRMLRGKPSKAFQRFMLECFDLMPRQALHAKTLGFVHPTLNCNAMFNSPFPADFRNLLLRMSAFMKLPVLPDVVQQDHTVIQFTPLA
jgi:23S rRNA pseudouridine1911/1915/1917 synthase